VEPGRDDKRGPLFALLTAWHRFKINKPHVFRLNRRLAHLSVIVRSRPLITDRRVGACRVVGLCEVIRPTVWTGFAVLAHCSNRHAFPVLVDESSQGFFGKASAELFTTEATIAKLVSQFSQLREFGKIQLRLSRRTDLTALN
jgi:hypothetical protein